MVDPKRVTEAWRELRPQLGEFLNRLDNCMVECGSNAEAYKKGYDLGYDRGSKKPPQCDICLKGDWWVKTAGDARLRKAIEEIMQLQPETQTLVYDLVDKLYSNKNVKIERIWEWPN